MIDSKTENAYEQAGYDEFDRIAESNERISAAISAIVDDLWADRESVCRVIEEIKPAIDYVFENSYDVAGDTEKLITTAFEIDAKADLNI